MHFRKVATVYFHIIGIDIDVFDKYKCTMWLFACIQFFVSLFFACLKKHASRCCMYSVFCLRCTHLQLSHLSQYVYKYTEAVIFSSPSQCCMAFQWVSLVGTIWLQSINGTNSNFPAYSSELKRLLSISQLKLNNLASASDAGKLLGWVSGVAAAHFPLWLVLLIGSLLGLVGYGIQYLFLTHHLSSHLSYWHIFFLTVLAGNGICWINTVCYIIAIRNFPLDRQIAVGLSTSYVGLSAKLYTDVVDVVAPSNSPSERAKVFLLSNALLPVVVCVAAAPLARNVNVGKTRKLGRGFFNMLVITIATGLLAVVTSLLGRVLPRYAILVGMLAMLALCLVVPLGEKVRERLQQQGLIRSVPDDGAGPAMEQATADESAVVAEIETAGTSSTEIGALTMVRRVEFWLYFFAYLLGATLGLVYLNNLGQIAESRGCSASATSSLVSLSSAFTFFGRLIPSLLHYIFPRKQGMVVTSAGAMGGMMAPICGALWLLLSGRQISLYISTAVIGICTGGITSLSVSTTTELFGAKNFGVNHNILVSNIPIGSFLFGDFAALLYKRREGEGNCMGQQCYQTTFMVWGSLCAVGVLLAFILHVRTKKFNSPPA